MLRCPLCDVAMREVSRRGVKVDVCPECRGVWLDRGELDHLIEAEPEYDGATAAREPRGSVRVEERVVESRARRRDDDDDDDDDRRRDRPSVDERGYAPQRKKRSSWLSEIFELGGGGD